MMNRVSVRMIWVSSEEEYKNHVQYKKCPQNNFTYWQYLTLKFIMYEQCEEQKSI